MNRIFFKENLKYIRNCYGLSQNEMSAKLNVPEKRYQSYEKGRSEPSLTQIYQFCCTINISTDNLITTNMELIFTPDALRKLAVKSSVTLHNVVQMA